MASHHAFTACPRRLPASMGAASWAVHRVSDSLWHRVAAGVARLRPVGVVIGLLLVIERQQLSSSPRCRNRPTGVAMELRWERHRGPCRAARLPGELHFGPWKLSPTCYSAANVSSSAARHDAGTGLPGWRWSFDGSGIVGHGIAARWDSLTMTTHRTTADATRETTGRLR